MNQIDMLGKPCPTPVIEAKKALAPSNAHEVTIKVDNMMAVQNLGKMAAGYGYAFSFKDGGEGIFNVTIQKNGNSAHGINPDEKNALPQRGASQRKNLVVVITSDELGGGAPELGKILMKSFIYSLTESETVPSAIIFMNRGAYLTALGSNTIADLKTLEDKGSEILTCGTCSDYYGLQNDLAAGSIADMFTITGKMAAADLVINL